MYDLNSIDSKNKYVFAHLFVEKRTKQKCRELFKQIKDTNYDQIKKQYEKEKHKTINKRKFITFVSDGFHNYETSAKHYFYPLAKFIAGVPIACNKYGLKHNNNAIERHNCKLKERLKIMRPGFRNQEYTESFMNLQRILHNFINPHQGLKGKTPAETAGIDLKLGRQKLLNLIKLKAKDNHHSQR